MLFKGFGGKTMSWPFRPSRPKQPPGHSGPFQPETTQLQPSLLPGGHVESEETATSKAVMIQSVSNQLREKYKIDIQLRTLDERKQEEQRSLQAELNNRMHAIRANINEWNKLSNYWTEGEWKLIMSIKALVDLQEQSG